MYVHSRVRSFPAYQIKSDLLKATPSESDHVRGRRGHVLNVRERRYRPLITYDGRVTAKA